MGISCLKALLKISSFRANFGVTVFKHCKGITYSQIQLNIYTHLRRHKTYFSYPCKFTQYCLPFT